VGKRVFGLQGGQRQVERVQERTGSYQGALISLLIVYLALEAPNIDIDHIGRRIEMNIPYMLEKHGARHDPAFVADQIFEELEFAGKELDFTPTPADLPRDEIDFEIADAQHVYRTTVTLRRASASTRASSSAKANGLTR
jgi:hypothetical protein